jgi:hypothetical protein
MRRLSPLRAADILRAVFIYACEGKRMKSSLVFLAVASVTAAVVAHAGGASDELMIEQLIHQRQLTRPMQPAKTAPARAKAKVVADPAAALIGQKVHVHTVDRGLYAGTLQSVDTSNVVLRIDLPKQVLSYTLPRSAVSELQIAESTP